MFVCRIYSGVGGLGGRLRLRNGIIRFRDNQLQMVLLRFTFIFTLCKEINTKCEF